jgi:hypothetical protein
LFHGLATGFIYFFVFRIGFFYRYFLRKYVRDPVAGPMDPDFFSNPFRWITLPHVPGLSDVMDGVVFVLLLIVIIMLNARALMERLKQREPALVFFLCGCGSVALLMLIQLGLYFAFAVPVWLPRYFTIAFVWMPVTCMMFIPKAGARWFNLVCMVLLAGCISRVAHEFRKVDERVAARGERLALVENARPGQEIIFIEKQGGDYRELAAFGEIYVRMPELRQHMVYVYDSLELDRHAYFKLMEKTDALQGLFVAAVDSARLSNAFVVSNANER